MRDRGCDPWYVAPVMRGPDVPQWEYMTWGVTRPHSDKAEIRFMDGRPLLNPQSLFDELERAGMAGWELVSTLPVGKRSGAMFFRHPSEED
jgi:hypothetical protein